MIKNIYLKYKFQNKLIFELSCDINLRQSSFEGANKICSRSVFSGKMGYGSYIANDCEIIANIGRFTSIAPYVRTNRGIHPIEKPFATTCPMFYTTRIGVGKTFAKKTAFEEFLPYADIGNDVWIQENVFFHAGLKIGDGAVILAGAVVTKDVPPYAIVGGVPAKVLKYRFDSETIDYLLKFKWWEKDIQWLEQNSELLCDIELFKRKYKQSNE